MPANLASIANILKEFYQPRVREQLENSALAYRRVTKSGAGVTNEIGGKYVTFPLHTRRNNGLGSRLEGEPLPNAGQQGYAAARVGLKYAYAAIQLTGQAITLSDTDPRAFAKALDEEVTRVKDDIAKDMNRQVYGDGSGAVAVVKTNGTGVNTVAVKDGRLFQLGELVDIQTGTTVNVTARTVNSIDLTSGANTVTLSGATFNVTAGDIFVRTSSGTTASGNRELTGFGAIINNSGTLYNVDPSVETVWKAHVYANGGTNRAISEGLMTQMADEIRTTGGKTTLILQSLGVRRAYANLLTQTRQTVNTTKFTGGFSGLAFTTDQGEIPLVADVDAPLNTQLFINEDALTYYRDEDWHWMDRDGNMWKQVQDANGTYDAWKAYMVEYHELGTDKRSTFGKISDITEE